MLGKKNGVHISERVKFRQSLDLKLKDEDITKWTDYKEIEALSNLINVTKKKNLSNVDLAMVVKLRNRISFENRILKLMNKPQIVNYRYVNTETKKNRLDNVSKFSKAFYRK